MTGISACWKIGANYVFSTFMEDLLWSMYLHRKLQKILDISRRRVTTLCREGRVEGAVFAANTWLVPKDAKKTEDPRRVRKMVQDK